MRDFSITIPGLEKERLSLSNRRDSWVTALSVAIITWLSMVVLLIAWTKMSQYLASPKELLLDFQIFYRAGRLIGSGHAGQVYSARQFAAIEEVATGTHSLISPFAYPPPFALLCSFLGSLPLGYSFLVFVVLSFAGFVITTVVLLGRASAYALVIAAPAILINLNSGQNGFMTAGLTGLFALGILRNSKWAGIPLGLMVIKPHLAVALVIFALVDRRHAVLCISFLTAVGFCLAATAFLGTSIWPDFLHGAKSASVFLGAGRFIPSRLVSLYAGLTAAQVSRQVAMAAQAFLVVGLLGSIAWFRRRSVETRVLVGLSIVASPMVSPYCYDYDLVMVGLGVALLLPVMSWPVKLGASVLTALASSWWTIFVMLGPHLGLVSTEIQAADRLSFGGLSLILLFALMAWSVMRRQSRVNSMTLTVANLLPKSGRLESSFK